MKFRYPINTFAKINKTNSKYKHYFDENFHSNSLDLEGNVFATFTFDNNHFVEKIDLKRNGEHIIADLALKPTPKILLIAFVLYAVFGNALINWHFDVFSITQKLVPLTFLSFFSYGVLWIFTLATIANKLK